MKATGKILSAILLAAMVSCGGGSKGNVPDVPDVPVTPDTPATPDDTGGQGEDDGGGSGDAAFFAKGADIGWVTEMESKGYKFYNNAGAERELTSLLKETGFNSVRYRVWVNPSSGFNNVDDVLAKCLRAKELGMKIMIDFHYSDTWADPSKQIIPAAWQGFTSSSQMASAVTEHTTSVLQTLKDNGIDVTWVQPGNEVTVGMLHHTGTEGHLSEAPASVSGKVEGSNTGHFTEYFKAGCDAAKAVFPEAKIILHIDNAWKTATLTWFYDLMKTADLDYDIIGLSLYPSYWENGGYPDWRSKTSQAVNNFKTLHERYSKPVMLVEWGMPASEPVKAREALQYILDGTSGQDWFEGIFFWEPEAESSRNDYDYGAFSGGKPTEALNPFAE